MQCQECHAIIYFPKAPFYKRKAPGRGSGQPVLIHRLTNNAKWVSWSGLILPGINVCRGDLTSSNQRFSDNSFLLRIIYPWRKQVDNIGNIYYAEYAEILQCRKEAVVNQLTIQIRDRGVFTLPSELRDKYDIGSGKIYQLIDLEGVFVLVPMIPMVPGLAQEIEAIRKESGLSMEELLAGLREQREKYSAEKYGK
jgi:bifunctional DNA-binding transcriptional regulator/antitoxin component of YhaV-PrlF toxin-antitoxin module